MKVKKLLFHYKNLILIAILFIVILFMWNFISSFSANIDSSAWDGIVAKSFASGTGSLDNPYVISNASEFAYFKSLLEGVDANFYADKNYLITASFNYGEHDIYIDNSVPFSGVIDGGYNTIDNALINKSLFNSLDGAVIKNIVLKNIRYFLNESEGAILANLVNDSSVEMLIISGDIVVDDLGKFGGLVYSSFDSAYVNASLAFSVSFFCTSSSAFFCASFPTVIYSEYTYPVTLPDCTFVHSPTGPMIFAA